MTGALWDSVPRGYAARMRLALIVAALVLSLPVSSAFAADKAKLVAQDLSPRGVSEAEAALLSSAVCEGLTSAKRLSVLCGDDLRAMMQMAALSASLDACEGDACFANVSAALKAKYLVSGSVSKVESKLILALALLDASSGEVLGRAQIEGLSFDRLHADVPEATGILLSELRQKRG